MICPKCKFSIPPGQSGCPRCSSQNKGSAFSSQANKSKIASAGASTSEQNEGICGSIKTFFLSEGAPKWQVILLVVLLFGGSFIKSYIASGENEKKEAARTASERNVMIDIDNLVSQNKYEEAIGKCDLIINSASSGDALKCGAIMAKAKSLGYLKKFPEAVKCCDDLLKIWPESASAYLMKGAIFFDMGKKKEAREALEKCIALDSKNKFTESARQLISELEKQGK